MKKVTKSGKKHKYIIYAFRLTAKQNIGGSKGIAKGMSVQIKKDVESSGKCKISELPEENILWAVEIQFLRGLRLILY